MALLYGRAGRLTIKNGGFWPGQKLSGPTGWSPSDYPTWPDEVTCASQSACTTSLSAAPSASLPAAPSASLRAALTLAQHPPLTPPHVSQTMQPGTARTLSGSPVAPQRTTASRAPASGGWMKHRPWSGPPSESGGRPARTPSVSTTTASAPSPASGPTPIPRPRRRTARARTSSRTTRTPTSSRRTSRSAAGRPRRRRS
jgi:hypothetical protein